MARNPSLSGAAGRLLRIAVWAGVVGLLGGSFALSHWAAELLHAFDDPAQASSPSAYTTSVDAGRAALRLAVMALAAAGALAALAIDSSSSPAAKFLVGGVGLVEVLCLALLRDALWQHVALVVPSGVASCTLLVCVILQAGALSAFCLLGLRAGIVDGSKRAIQKPPAQK